MRYHIVNTPRLEMLMTEVNRMLEAGWEPLGGVTVHINYSNYLQAMILRDK